MPRSSAEECVARVMAAGRITENQAATIIENLADRADQMRKTGADDPVVTAAWRAAQEIREAAILNRKEVVANALIRQNVLDWIDREGGLRNLTGAERTLALGYLRRGTKAAQVIRSLIWKVPGASMYESAQGLGHGLSKQWISQVAVALRRTPGLEDIAISGADDRGISEALWRLNGGTPNTAVTVSANAQKIAEAVHPILALARERQNDAGARIGNALDFVTSTNWDQRQLRLAAGKGASYDAAYQAWRARDVPRMAEKTFDQVSPKEGETMAQARERFLRSVFEATESGVHMAFMGDDAASSYVPMAFEGTRNVARSLSHQRVVYWKSADDWLAHQREFGGGGTLYRQITNSLDLAGRRTAVMKIWGTNPTGNLNTILRRVQEKYRTDENLERFNGEVEGLRHSLGWLDGTNNIGLNADRARRVNYFMALEGLSHLGGVAITHLFSAPATFGSEMAHHGVSPLESLGRIVSSTLTGRAGGERAEIMADAGSYAHGALLNIALHRDAGDGLPGWVSQKAAQFMRLTGLPRILERIQTDAVKSVLMTRLGRDAGKEFGQLLPEQAQILSRYGIGEREWNLLRGVADPIILGGQRYISPSDSLKISDAAAMAHLGTELSDNPAARANQIRSLRWDIGDRYLSYLNDTAEQGAVTPGVREKSLMLRNFAPGSVPWMAMRLIAQFKMWPIAAVNQMINREIAAAANLTPGRVAWNVGTLLTLATIGGSLRMALNDFAVGNPQRNWRDPVTLLAGLAQGGGIGIYGDFLFGEASRMGTDIEHTVMGPAVSDLDRLATMASRFRADLRDQPDHALRHLWPDLAHFLVGHVPFGNLIYLKGALDYLLWYHLYEAASPGWWRRTNQRLEKERGRVMQGYHPGGTVPWSPWGLGARTQAP